MQGPCNDVPEAPEENRDCDRVAEHSEIIARGYPLSMPQEGQPDAKIRPLEPAELSILALCGAILR